MMPGGVLSTRPAPGRFSGARSGATSKTIDYEDGGIAIQDPSQGLLYQRWRARLVRSGEVDSVVLLDAPSVPEFVWLSVPYMTEISFSFDANMQSVVAYVAQGRACLNWFDSQSSQYVTTTLAADVITPRVSLDDKRYVGSNGYQNSDVILAYVRGVNLYMRVQRERYGTEHLLAEGVTPLIKVGFSRGLRFQYMCEVT